MSYIWSKNNLSLLNIKDFNDGILNNILECYICLEAIMIEQYCEYAQGSNLHHFKYWKYLFIILFIYSFCFY
jgi:hypothetical protein